MIKNLYNYRQLLKSNVQKEIRGKYKGSFLGVLWSFVNPLLQVLVYALVFPFIMKNTQDNYVVFLIIGILPWTWFVTSITQGTSCILANEGIIKKVYFPREILPISVITSGLINFIISCIVIFLFLLFSGVGFSIYIVFVPFIIMIQYILSLGILLITSAIDVYIRDAEYIINFIVNMLFYATPILYSPDIFANSSISWLMKINPLSVIITGYRDTLFYQVMPNLSSLFLILLASLLLLFIGMAIFRKLEKGFAEEV